MKIQVLMLELEKHERIAAALKTVISYYHINKAKSKKKRILKAIKIRKPRMMNAAQRKAVSIRMKAYWNKRKSAKKSPK